MSETNLNSLDPEHHGSSSRDTEPVTKETKQALLGTIRKKVLSKDAFAYGWALPDNLSTKFVLGFTVKDKDRKEEGGVQEIARVVKHDIKPNGLEEVTVYRLILTPDETTEIDKSISLENPKEIDEVLGAAFLTVDGDERRKASSNLREILLSKIAAEKEAREMGLGFVPQHEATTLLEELERAQPVTVSEFRLIPSQ
jgi:hypothetical protein